MKRNMDRKLRDAYNKMTMPDDCAQRIERMLQGKGNPQERKRERTVYPPRSKGQAWGSVAVLVCLAAVIFLSGVLAFAHMGQWEEREILQPEQGTEQGIPEPAYPLSEEGENFLLAMCSAMPDWESYFVLNDDFWEEFLYGSFCDPEEGKNGMVSTLIGEIPCEDGTVLITREQAEAYAALTMDCDLPLPREAGEKDGRMWYSEGVYHIRLSETNPRLYALSAVGGRQGEIRSADFGIYDEAGRVLGTVRFGLRTADNANGFVITSKHTDWEIPEESVRLVTGQDQDAVLREGKDVFQQSIRGTVDYTAHQYHLSWDGGRLLSSRLCIVYEDENQDSFLKSKPYILENGSWNEMETKQPDRFYTNDGKEWKMPFSNIESEEGIRYNLSFSPIENFTIDYCYQNPGRNPWWIAYQWEETLDAYVSYELGITAGPWRLDPATGELKDLWGNVPEARRASGIQWYFREIQFFEDGGFLIPALDEDREIKMLYVDPEAGQVYDLETLCGTQLEDYIGSPATDEIYCWKDGEYWRIPRDTLRPEYLGKLQEDVVFASGVLGGQWATFSIERLGEGGYRVYDYVRNRFLTLGDFPNPYGNPVDWDAVEASPDGRKLLTSQATSLLQVLDCDAGKLLSVERKQNSTSGNELGWLMSGEIYVKTISWEIRDYVIYTLK